MNFIATIPATKKRIQVKMPEILVTIKEINARISSVTPITLVFVVTKTMVIAIIEIKIDATIENAVKSPRGTESSSEEPVRAEESRAKEAKPKRIIGTTTIPKIPPIKVRVW